MLAEETEDAFLIHASRITTGPRPMVTGYSTFPTDLQAHHINQH